MGQRLLKMKTARTHAHFFWHVLLSVCVFLKVWNMWERWGWGCVYVRVCVHVCFCKCAYMCSCFMYVYICQYSNTFAIKQKYKIEREILH